LPAVSGRDQRLDTLQRSLVRLDVDACRGVRQPLRGHQAFGVRAGDGGPGTWSDLSGSSNCILSISSCCGTGTGYEPSKHARQNCSEVPRPMARMSPGMERYDRLSAPMCSRTCSTVRPAAINSLVEPMSTPMKHG